MLTHLPPFRPTSQVPTPFSFEHRPKRDHSAMRKMAAELEQQRAELDEVRQQVKARPVPPTTAPGLYTKQVAEMEERSRERRAIR